MVIFRAGMYKPRAQIAQTTKLCTVASNICGSPVWNLLHVTLLVPRILMRLIDF
jgi:hypothetical protein